MFKKPSPDIVLTQEDNKIEPQRDEVETIVGPSVCVEGDFASEGKIVVKGTVCGTVKTTKLLTVEAGAKILANVKAGEALISGQVKGNLRVTGRLELTETAQVAGDVSCKELIVAAGALVHGKIVMKGINIESAKLEKKRVLGRPKSKIAKKEEQESK